MNTNNFQTGYLGATQIREVRQGTQLVAAPRGDSLWYKANSLPTLDLNFATNRSLLDNVSNTTLVDHTRQSSATYVDGDGVIRTAVTNLLLQSEDFSTTWTLGGNTTVTPNYGTAPNGTQTADRVEMPNDIGTVVTQSVTTVSGLTYVFSVYARATSGSSKLALVLGTANEQFSLTEAWQRYSVSFTATGTSTTAQLDNGSNAIDVLVWGAQLEESSTVGQYVKTTTAINSAPRFDHDPTTGESLGLLVEESRTNLLVQSEDFSTTWNTARLRAFGSGSTVNATTAPNGTLTADFIQQASGQTSAGNVNVSTNTATPTVSVYAKASTKSKISILTDVGGNSETWFDLASGTVGTQQSNHTASIVSVGDGWYRCIVSSSATATFFSIYLADTDGSRTVTDSGGVYLWGAQLESGSFPTSYIPTEGSTVTRAADVASITGTNFSSWYEQSEGTVFSDWSTSATSEQTAWAISDGTLNESLRASTLVSVISNNTRLVVLDGNSLQAGLAVGVYTPGSRRKIALACQQDNFAGVADGAAVIADTSGTLPLVDRLFIGANWAGSGSFLGGPIRRLTYWPTRLSNDTLQTITT